MSLYRDNHPETSTKGTGFKNKQVKNIFFLKTLGRQIDVKREIHIHLYLANNSVLV